jgi:hypothetical protein
MSCINTFIIQKPKIVELRTKKTGKNHDSIKPSKKIKISTKKNSKYQ